MDGLFILIFIAGMAAMAVMMLLCSKKYYGIKKSRIIWLIILCSIAGVLCVKLMFFIESGNWSGQSYFGAVFFLPVFLILIAWIVRIPYYQAADLCAPANCVMLALMKVQCLRAGCCIGRVLWLNKFGEEVRYPSRVTELVFALAIMVFLIEMMKNEKWRGKIYPLFMIAYGCIRFLLNLTRETEPFLWIIPAGNLWSMVSVAAGYIWLHMLKGKKITAVKKTKVKAK